MATSLPPAPEFPAGLTWWNVDHPLRLGDELRGQVVILDFWTYCCINCMHVLPDLEWLEQTYAHEPVTIIGVHSNKYTNEGDPANVRQAILRYGITHPVVVDTAHQIWNNFGVNAWPTLVVIDSTGHVAAVAPGEGHREELDTFVSTLLARGRAEGTLAAGPIATTPEAPPHPSSGLLYPGKVLADERRRQLFIADSDHHRILITDWNGEVLAYLGNGKRGLVNGPYGDAQFNNPQGMALIDRDLYIADTDNHALRRANLDTFHVDTVLGTGEIGYDRRGGHPPQQQTLNSPWDVVFLDGLLYIAMAGLHQIWAYDPLGGLARAVIGTGRENITDNPAPRAALAQPSGLAAANGVLYFADSETSAIRQYDPRTQQVSTLVGKGLFTFGDIDGRTTDALLQHPLGVAATEHSLIVADTYNHKIRKIDLRTGMVNTMAGTGAPGTGMPGGILGLYEPGGISVAGNDLFIADTNNHRIIHCRLETGQWEEITPNAGGMPFSTAA